MDENKIHFKNWKQYQKRLKRVEKRRNLLNRLPLISIYAFGLFFAIISIFFAGSWLFANLEGVSRPDIIDIPEDNQPVELSKSDLPYILMNSRLLPSQKTGDYILKDEAGKLVAATSLDTGLQNYITGLLKRSLTHQAAVVVVRPDNGQILAMVSFGGEGVSEDGNLCLDPDSPAASIFKIISAAAAIEAKNFTPNKVLNYRGGRYTLYKSQLNQDKGKYSTDISFKEAFSESVNPVFGKLGIYDLGKELLDQYSERFYFNRKIPFDLAFGQSRVEVPEDDFGLAEIACGFNKRTLLSPLHAALITSAVANNGFIMEPWMISKVTDSSEKVIYRAKPAGLTQPIKKETADQLKILMEDTVLNGTCRKAFSSLRKKKAFRSIKLGAKTGTINDRLDKYKFDWLTAYALPEDGSSRGIALAVLAVHGEKLGIRAKDLARYVIDFHFKS